MLSTVGSCSASIQGHRGPSQCVTSGAHLEQIQPQVRFLLILQVSPFKARAKANHGSPNSWRSGLSCPPLSSRGSEMLAKLSLAAGLAGDKGEVVQWVWRE